MNSGEIPEEILKRFQFYLVKVDGHRRDKLHPGCAVTCDMFEEPLLIRWHSGERKFYAVGDMSDTELESTFEEWLPINMDMADGLVLKLRKEE